MKLNPVLQTFVAWPQRLFLRARGMFNLNDSRWGRDESSAGDSSNPGPSDRPAAPVPPPATPPAPPNGSPQRPAGSSGQQGPTQGPPDLDELWRDFNRKLGGLLGGRRGGGGRPGGGCCRPNPSAWGGMRGNVECNEFIC